MALTQYSLSNIGNSIAAYLAQQLIADGYLIYWRSMDALQTEDGLYTGWQDNQTSILSNVNVAAAYASSRGIISVLDPDLAVPATAVRPTVEGETPGPDAVPVPSLTIQAAHETSGTLLELGSKRRERWAVLSVVGYGRTMAEAHYLVDRLRDWFDELVYIPLRNHDDGSLALLQSLEVHDTAVTATVVPLEQEAQMYEIALSASLRYEA